MAEASGGGLRRRLAVALVGLAATAAAIQGIGYWVAERWVEHESLQGLLQHELSHLVETDAQPTLIAANDPTLRYFRPARGEPVPPALKALTPGWHEEVSLEGKQYRALVADIGPSDRAWLLYDISGVDVRERRLILLFGFGVLAIAALAFWASRRLAARALAPFDDLVQGIRALNPETRGARLRVDGDAELRVIAEALNSYMRALDDVIERERAFAAAASHELRTPLTVIAGATELLASKPADPARPLARIDRAVTQAMLDLDALLALSRVREPPQATRLVLDKLLPDWAEPHLANLSTQIVWELQAAVLDAPMGSLHIVFTNLLRNALRAAGPRGCLILRCSGTGLDVIDNGPGIPPAELPHVFEPHFRGRDGGTGIGLYVARALAQSQGWQLSLVNREEGGAHAALRWPPVADQTSRSAVSIR
jgi:signal transduction histidine kinase